MSIDPGRKGVRDKGLVTPRARTYRRFRTYQGNLVARVKMVQVHSISSSESLVTGRGWLPVDAFRSAAALLERARSRFSRSSARSASPAHAAAAFSAMARTLISGLAAACLRCSASWVRQSVDDGVMDILGREGTRTVSSWGFFRATPSTMVARRWILEPPPSLACGLPCYPCAVPWPRPFLPLNVRPMGTPPSRRAGNVRVMGWGASACSDPRRLRGSILVNARSLRATPVASREAAPPAGAGHANDVRTCGVACRCGHR